MFAAILVAEEVLDVLQREAAADERVQPLVRMVSRIHVVEEARHVRYAREELARQVRAASRTRIGFDRLVIARSAYLTGREGEFQRTLERLYRAHVASGALPRATRCAFWTCRSTRKRSCSA